MTSFLDLFGGAAQPDGGWCFELDERFNGAFGGTNGGTLTALSVFVARQVSGRRPTSIDSRYLRGFRPGTARLQASVVSEGRTLMVVGVDVIDHEEKICTRSTITLVDPDALAAALDSEPSHAAPELSPPDQQRPWSAPKGQPIPLIDTYRPVQLGRAGDATVTGVDIPWNESGTGAEAACIAADMSVGPPVARIARGQASTPNPDLSLRFCAIPDLVSRPFASCRVARISAGLATTELSVWSETELLAIGISTTTCLPLARSTPSTRRSG